MGLDLYDGVVRCWNMKCLRFVGIGFAIAIAFLDVMKRTMNRECISNNVCN